MNRLLTLSCSTTLVGLLLCSCYSTAVHPVSDQHYAPVVRSADEVRLFVDQPIEDYAEIAYVDSFVNALQSNEIKRDQLIDLQQKASEIGADAIIELERLEERREGFIVDPTVPYNAWKQGDSKLYFMRGLAVRLHTTDDQEWEARNLSDSESQLAQNELDRKNLNLNLIQDGTSLEEATLEPTKPGI